MVVYLVIPEATVAEADSSRIGTFKSFKSFDPILELNQMDRRLHMKIQKENFSLEPAYFKPLLMGLPFILLRKRRNGFFEIEGPRQYHL